MIDAFRYIQRKSKPRKCPICGGEVCPSKYCLSDHDAKWQCCDCETPIYVENEKYPLDNNMIYTTYIESYSLNPIRDVIIHMAYNSKTKECSSWGKVRGNGNDDIKESCMSTRKMKEFFKKERIDEYMTTPKIPLPDILDGTWAKLNIQVYGKKKIQEANSENMDSIYYFDFFRSCVDKLLKESELKMY